MGNPHLTPNTINALTHESSRKGLFYENPLKPSKFHSVSVAKKIRTEKVKCT